LDFGFSDDPITRSSVMNTRLLFGSILPVVLSVPLSATALTISGKVRNSTSARPAANDDVILLRLGNGMEEESRTRTDAQGAFTLNESSATAQYVVRVMHQGVNYDHTVTGSAPFEIEVFDSAPKVQGLSGKIGIAQVESDGKVLKVTEMYAIDNASAPPVTQSGARNFEIFLPEKGAFDSVEASRGNGIWIKTPPVPLKGRPGRYAVDFPLRPGPTLIKFTYHLPYAGPTSFHLKVPYPIKRFAVMHPPTMVFKALRRGTFNNPGKANGLEIEAAVTQPLVDDVPPFEISGVGAAVPLASATPDVPPVAALHPAGQAAQSGQAAQADAAQSLEPRPESWLVPLTVASLLSVAGLAFWRIRRTRPVATAGASTPAWAKSAQSGDPGAPSLREALKEELFQLEIDRACGSISADDFAAAKQALDRTLKRAIGSEKR
jgi:hypothetical protein